MTLVVSDDQRPECTLDGQVALVTGASSGLGSRFARVIARAGAGVVVAARRTDRIATLADEITDAGGIAHPARLDVDRPESFAAVLDEVQDRLGRVSILVNNAGIPHGTRPHKITIDEADTVLSTNLRGPLLLCCEVASRMIADGTRGRIVNVSSMAAFHYTATPTAALYAVTKAASARMTEVLAVEWAGYGINVTGIAPGVFRSEMTDGMIERIGDPSAELPRQRIPGPDLLDSTLLYLISPASAAVTGTVIKVDDGQFGR